jgi:hypothetical protein
LNAVGEVELAPVVKGDPVLFAALRRFSFKVEEGFAARKPEPFPIKGELADMDSESFATDFCFRTVAVNEIQFVTDEQESAVFGAARDAVMRIAEGEKIGLSQRLEVIG